MNCRNCGFEFEEGIKFCPGCGTKVEIEENNTFEINDDKTVDKNDIDNQSEAVTTINDNIDKKSLIKEIMADEKKKKIFIAAVAAIVIVLIALIAVTSKSDPNNYYGNGDSYNNDYNDYDDNFGNSEVITQPQTTEVFKLDYDVEADEKLYDDCGVIATISDYKFVPKNSVYGVCWGFEIIFNFEILDNSKNSEFFSYDLEYYDDNGNLIGTDDCITSIIDGKARGTTLISFDMLNGELSKIVVLDGD